MVLTKNEIKKRHWKKVYDSATYVDCACGCGIRLKNKDKYGRDRSYINGHNNRKYPGKYDYKKVWLNKNPDWKRKYRKRMRITKRIELIELIGGMCHECGLKFDGNNHYVFDFHHIDPTKKKYKLNGAGLMNISKAKAISELEKCILLCSNCHRKIHYADCCIDA